MFDIAATKNKVKDRISRKMSTKSQGVATDYEVLIIGAGIAGVGAACYLQQHKGSVFKQDKSRRNTIRTRFKAASHKTTAPFLVVEKRSDLGGTWDLFTYPGIRSDSDALTFGYSFRPWLDHRMLAGGDDIKRYIKDTAREYGITEHIRYQHEVQQLSWSSSDQRWSATIKNHASGEVFSLTANFIIGATGYYDYEHGYQPRFDGEEDFKGQIIHPQHWHDIDYDDKKIAIIGSGATAMTLLPALVDEESTQCAQHVTMVQRTPTYVASVPGDDYAIDWLSAKYSPLSKQQAYTLLRVRNVLRQQGVYQFAIHAPSVMRALLKHWAKQELKGSGVTVDNFLPDYNPWEERLCAVPDSDLFLALQGDRADVVTDDISHFTKTGIQLESGTHIDADIIVTATGLKLQMLGGAQVYVDGEVVDVGARMTYKAVMVENVPNLAVIFGYTNASWTLKVDLACQYLLRLFSYMKKKGYRVALPQAKVADEEAKAQEDTIMGSLSAGYIRRAKDELPKQGDRYPWFVTSSYLKDRLMLKHRKINDKWLKFNR